MQKKTINILVQKRNKDEPAPESPTPPVRVISHLQRINGIIQRGLCRFVMQFRALILILDSLPLLPPSPKAIKVHSIQWVTGWTKRFGWLFNVTHLCRPLAEGIQSVNWVKDSSSISIPHRSIIQQDGRTGQANDEDDEWLFIHKVHIEDEDSPYPEWMKE